MSGLVVQDPYSLINVSYENNSINNGSSLSLSSFPIDITKVITIKIANNGNIPLLISSISVVGDGELSSGSLGSSSSIPAFSFGNININLLINSEGNKSINIQIVSNSRTNSIYNIVLTYAVLQQYKIEFKEGFSSGKQDSILVDGQINNFGTIEKERSLSRYFVLNNSGIYKNIVINSITSSSSDMVLLDMPSLPFDLIPNNGNSIVFSINFETSEVGLKEGVLVIDYEEGSVYVPPAPQEPPILPAPPTPPPTPPAPSIEL